MTQHLTLSEEIDRACPCISVLNTQDRSGSWELSVWLTHCPACIMCRSLMSRTKRYCAVWYKHIFQDRYSRIKNRNRKLCVTLMGFHVWIFELGLCCFCFVSFGILVLLWWCNWVRKKKGRWSRSLITEFLIALQQTTESQGLKLIFSY